MKDPAIIARWLYRFGTAPRGPWVERDFGPEDDPMGVIGLTAGGRARRLMEPHYEATSFPGWYSFSLRGYDTLMSSACKLYVSPRGEALADAFPIIVDQFAQADVRSFKVGRGIGGLLRPDKLVAYFTDRSHLAEVATALKRNLEGCPAQGVPFTAEIAGDGLLSSGADPPFGGPESSWRAWISRKLADALVEARSVRGGDAVELTLEAIRRWGVDPISWTSVADIYEGVAVDGRGI